MQPIIVYPEIFHLCTDSRKYLNIFMFGLCLLCKSFWTFINTVIRDDCHDHINFEMNLKMHIEFVPVLLTHFTDTLWWVTGSIICDTVYQHTTSFTIILSWSLRNIYLCIVHAYNCTKCLVIFTYTLRFILNFINIVMRANKISRCLVQYT